MNNINKFDYNINYYILIKCTNNIIINDLLNLLNDLLIFISKQII